MKNPLFIIAEVILLLGTSEAFRHILLGKPINFQSVAAKSLLLHFPSRSRAETGRYAASKVEPPAAAEGKEVEETSTSLKNLRDNLDKEFIGVAIPAFVGLAADPLASIVDAMYVGRLGAGDQAGMGIAISAQYSVAKLYNDPLLKTSTSLVAGKSGEELSASVATAVMTAAVIGVLQSIGFFFFSSQILSIMGVPRTSDMRGPAIKYLLWRAAGIPAATMLLVTNGIFRGRGDTRTPLYCTMLGNLVNIILDPILIFTCNMGCAGAGAATSISQWVAAAPLLYLLNKKIPFNVFSRETGFLQQAFSAYSRAGALILLRTVAKIASYTVTSSAAARLGTVPMAAYSLTFNLGFATSQLCEAISIAAQALIARDIPLDSPRKKAATAHVITRGMQLGIVVSAVLAAVTIVHKDGVIASMTSSPEVHKAASAVMPMVLLTQLFKGMSYSTGGILLGGLDWFQSTVSMCVAALACIGCVKLLPGSLWNIWVALAAFMGTQVMYAAGRLISARGPWEGLGLLSADPDRFLKKTSASTGTGGSSSTSSANAADSDSVVNNGDSGSKNDKEEQQDEGRASSGDASPALA